MDYIKELNRTLCILYDVIGDEKSYKRYMLLRDAIISLTDILKGLENGLYKGIK